ncbi:hypothetical protein KEJ33_06345 [Candidatus Bathyarchaeota archaeon]|nr:hypothetical protein [Candidatus Bathyarchaeota archaeon]
MSLMRRIEIPLTISGIIVGIILIDTFSGDKTVRAISTTLQSWAIILAGAAMGIGAINLIRRQIRNIQSKRMIVRSVGIIVLLLVMLASGVVDLNLQNPVYTFIVNNFYSKIYGAGWAFQYFFLYYGLYRAYRVRNVDSLFLFIGSVLIILKSAAIFQVIMGDPIVMLGDWILSVPNLAGNRAIIIASSLGIVLLGLRVLLGKERGFLRREVG